MGLLANLPTRPDTFARAWKDTAITKQDAGFERDTKATQLGRDVGAVGRFVGLAGATAAAPVTGAILFAFDGFKDTFRGSCVSKYSPVLRTLGAAGLALGVGAAATGIDHLTGVFGGNTPSWLSNMITGAELYIGVRYVGDVAKAWVTTNAMVSAWLGKGGNAIGDATDKAINDISASWRKVES